MRLGNSNSYRSITNSWFWRSTETLKTYKEKTDAQSHWKKWSTWMKMKRDYGAKCPYHSSWRSSFMESNIFHKVDEEILKSAVLLNIIYSTQNLSTLKYNWQMRCIQNNFFTLLTVLKVFSCWIVSVQVLCLREKNVRGYCFFCVHIFINITERKIVFN